MGFGRVEAVVGLEMWEKGWKWLLYGAEPGRAAPSAPSPSLGDTDTKKPAPTGLKPPKSEKKLKKEVIFKS